MSVPNPMPSACTPIRLISFSNSQRASYSRKPVALTIGSDSYAYVLGDSAGFGAGNIGASDRRCRRKAHSPAAARPQSLEYRVPPAKAHGLTIYSPPTLLGPYDVTNYDPTFTAVFTNKTDCALSRRRAPAWRLGQEEGLLDVERTTLRSTASKSDRHSQASVAMKVGASECRA